MYIKINISKFIYNLYRLYSYSKPIPWFVELIDRVPYHEIKVCVGRNIYTSRDYYSLYSSIYSFRTILPAQTYFSDFANDDKKSRITISYISNLIETPYAYIQDNVINENMRRITVSLDGTSHIIMVKKI